MRPTVIDLKPTGGDDTELVQKAILDCISKGTVLLSQPTDVYRCGPLTIPGPLRWLGRGAMIWNIDPKSPSIRITINKAIGIFIEDLAIESGPECVDGSGGVLITESSNITLNTVHVINTHGGDCGGIGIGRQSSNVRLEDCRVTNHRKGQTKMPAMWAAESSRNIEFINPTVNGLALSDADRGIGIDFDRVIDGVIRNPVIDHMGTGLICEDNLWSDRQDVRIDGGTISHCSGDGISLHSYWGSARISGVAVRHNGRHGLSCYVDEGWNYGKAHRIETVILHRCVFEDNMSLGCDMSGNRNKSGQIKFATAGHDNCTMLVNQCEFMGPENQDYAHILYGSGALFVQQSIFRGGENAIRAFVADPNSDGYLPVQYQGLPENRINFRADHNVYFIKGYPLNGVFPLP